MAWAVQSPHQIRVKVFWKIIDDNVRTRNNDKVRTRNDDNVWQKLQEFVIKFFQNNVSFEWRCVVVQMTMFGQGKQWQNPQEHVIKYRQNNVSFEWRCVVIQRKRKDWILRINVIYQYENEIVDSLLRIYLLFSYLILTHFFFK